MIDIKPTVLEYKPPLTAQATEYVTVTNNSDQAVVFKVKTTAPKFYCVRPNAALVAPGEQVQVQVILLGLAEEPAADFKCRDKFLVITLPAPYDLGTSSVTEAWPQLEAEFKQHAVSKKIKVKYLLGEESSVDEPSTSSENKTSGGTVIQSEPDNKDIKDVTVKPNAPASEPLSETKKDLTTGSEETSKETKAQSELESKTGTANASLQGSSKQETPLNLAIILFVALIALVLGWMYY
ncbi:LANO_0F12068g1_1 [Lachancea nothofagi CBS 11611]|uniref:LANO_0F12068g1_1 n=1 Tax=Lachancea nothofagi CBS 11611 TaxID=1266666 RepID=A0A1G4KB50_9SACH|nr:LANO_0F12068g1_1 [Lachancea nothofagi CBS 11611]